MLHQSGGLGLGEQSHWPHPVTSSVQALRSVPAFLTLPPPQGALSLTVCGLVSLMDPEPFRLSHPPPPSRARVPLESRVGNSTQIFPSQQASDSGTDADEQSVSGEASGKLRGWQSNTSWVARIRITQILEL